MDELGLIVQQNSIFRMPSQGKEEDREKIKYHMIYHSMQDRLNQILESNSSMKNIRLASAHQICSNYKNASGRERREAELTITKMGKKVGFQTVGLEQRSSIKDFAGIKSSMHIKSRKNLIQNPNIKTVKSLNSSFVGQFTRTDLNRTNQSIRTVNPELSEAKKIVSEILKKYQVFFSTDITQKQIMEWIQTYCQGQRSLLLKLFLKYRKLSCSKTRKLKTVITLQLDQDVLHAKLQRRIKDPHLSLSRYITSPELQAASTYLESSFIQKMKIKTKEFQESIGLKMMTMCDRIRRQEDNDFLLNIRSKPIEISNFLFDLKDFQDSFGGLKKVNTLNRVRFKMLNDTDELINNHCKQINLKVNSSVKKLESVSLFS